MGKQTNVRLAFAHLFRAMTASSLLLSSAASAQGVPCDGTGTLPCGFQIQEVKLQPAPQVFKFQARVSQAKLPIGQGVFDRVVVNLKRGDANLCREEFSDVVVQDSVINLEIGRNMSCEIDQVIAENQNLAFQVCIGGPENCLRPIELASTPYAVKSTFASEAQQAYQADVSAQANYAHRLTADRDLFVTKELGTGYFDFYTPGEAPMLYTPSEFEAYENGGFLQWTPMNEQAPTLHIVAKNHGTDQMIPLEKLVLGANATETSGRLNVRTGGMHVVGSSDVTGNTTVRGQLKVEKPAGTGPQGLHVNGNSDVTGRFSVTDTLTMGAGGMMCEGPSSFTGQVTAQDVQVNGVLRVNGELSIPGEVNMGGVSSDFSVGNDLVVGGGAQVTDGLAVAGGMSLLPSANGNGGTALSHGAADTLLLNEGGAMSGGTAVQSALSVSGATALNGGATVNGAFQVSGALSTSDNDVTVSDTLNAQALQTPAIRTSGTATVMAGTAQSFGRFTASGGLTTGNGNVLSGGNLLNDGTTLNGGATVNSGLTVATGDLNVNGGAIRLNGANVSAVNIGSSGLFSASRNVAGISTTVLWSTNRTVCYLVHFNVGDLWEDDDAAACHIYAEGGFWKMNAFVSHDGCDAYCQAQCLTW